MFEKIESQILLLKENAPNPMPLNCSNQINCYRIALVRESIFHRILELAQGVLANCKKENVLTAIILQRAYMETESLFFEFINEVDIAIISNNTKKIDDLLTNILTGTRITNVDPKSKRPSTKNVLTYIDKMEKNFKGYRQLYDSLSEFAHPNSAGLNWMYTDRNSKSGQILFGSKDEAKKIEIIINMLELSLDHFIKIYDYSADLLDSYYFPKSEQ